MNRRLLVIIPAFNEAEVIRQTIKNLRKVLPGGAQILVVDDGSTDRTESVARKTGAIIISHMVNRGLGGALGTGLYWAKAHNVQYAVTFDADGQHNPEDLSMIISPLLNKSADVVIGSRTSLGWNDIPFDRKIMITLSNFFTWWISGIKTSDSLSGFRAFNRESIEKIQLRTDQMEASNEFFSEIKSKKLRLAEVPIHVIYTPYSRSKGQKNSNALDVAMKMLIRLVR